MTLRLNGSTSGYTEIDAPAVAGSNTLRLPTGNGSDGNILGTDGAGNLSWVNGRMVLATAQNTTSGTSIDFTGIPSWVKKVSVMLNGVSGNGSSILQLQLGSGSFVTTGYSVNAGYALNAGASVIANATTGFILSGASAAGSFYSGSALFTAMGNNTWVFSWSGTIGSLTFCAGGGSVLLSGALDRIRLTTVNGTDTFDAGSINILYEG
jgi:hypothetical protein